MVRNGSGLVVSVQDTDEDDDDDEGETVIESTKKEVEQSIAIVPVMEPLGKILKKIEAQEKSMLAINNTLGDLGRKVGKLQEIGERQEMDLAVIKANLKARPGHWCSLCKSSIHAFEECSSRRKKANLGAAQCAECGEYGHASALHFVSDLKLKNNIRIKFGAHFIFK